MEVFRWIRDLIEGQVGTEGIHSPKTASLTMDRPSGFKRLWFCLLLALPLHSLAQSCATTPASYVWHYQNDGLDGYSLSSFSACSRFKGWHFGPPNFDYTVVASVSSGDDMAHFGAQAACRTTTVYGAGPQVAGNYFIGLTLEGGGCPGYELALTPPKAKVCSADCITPPAPKDPINTGNPVSTEDPINPAIGSVYETEVDIPPLGSPDGISFRRYYNSADHVGGADMAAGWRRSYGRSVAIIYETDLSQFPSNAVFSSSYSTPGQACTQGFGEIQASVSHWAGATATYSNGHCAISNGSSTISTVPVLATTPAQPSPTPIEYDVIRDDGETLRYPLQNGAFGPQPGNSIRFAVTASGFTVTDDQDNVEVYNSAGVLQTVTSRAGVIQTVSYDANGLLTGVTDTFGSAFTVTRDSPDNRIVGVTVSGGGSVSLTYDAATRQLSGTTNLDGTSRTYTYVYGSLLSSVIDEVGKTFSTWNYDVSTGKVLNFQQAGGANSTSLVYNSDGSVTVTSAPTNGGTTGSSRTFNYSRIGDNNQATSISGAQCPSCADMAATTYDSAGWLSSETDYNGNLTCFANDLTRGLELVRVEGFAPGSTCPSNLSGYSPASGTTQRKISTTWHTTFRLPTQIVEPNRSTAFTYDGYGNLLTKTITDTATSATRTWTYTYNGYGQVLTAKAPRTDVNSTTTYTYYSCSGGSQCGRLHTVTDALGHVTTYLTYNGFGRPLTLTNPNNTLITLTYDARQRLSSRQQGSELTAITYWPTGLPKRVTLPDNSYVQYSYDDAHRLTQISDGASNTITYTLDAAGNRTAENDKDSSGVLHRTHSWVFNSLSQLYQDVNAAGTSSVTTTYGYDPQGNRTSTAAPLSRNSSSTYDALNRLKQVTNPLSGITQIGYDANDNLTSVTDPRSLTTSYAYSGFGDLVTQSSPDTGSTSNTYDSSGNLATSTDARGAVTTYVYDKVNRPTSISYQIGGTTDQTIAWTYDAGANGIGHVTGASDTNHTLAWVYDALGRVTGKTQTVGAISKALAYSYTSADLTAITTPAGRTITYGYNTNHQITSVAVNGTTVLNGVGYEPFGAVNGWTWGNGTSAVRTFDTNGDISTITSSMSRSYSLDNAERITGIADNGNSALSWTYNYDSLDRLSTATGAAQTHAFTYDANGNRLMLSGTSSASYSIANSSNRLTGVSGGLSRTYAYDAAGHTSGYAGVTFAYNAAGRMASSANGSTTTTYAYNALGQRVRKSTSAGSTVFVYDEAGHLIGEYDGTGAAIQEIVWLGDTPVATIRQAACGLSIFYIHTDHLNTPRRITRRSTSDVVWSWDGDPFGSAAPIENPAGLGVFSFNLRFPGQYFDAETGLTQNYMRDYDPATGRYVESDLLGLRAGVNTYAYVRNNPISRIDPFGLMPPPIVPPTIGQNAAQQNVNYLMQNPPSPQQFYNLVKNGGPWDYKQYGSDYQNFGNYNFGAAAAASGLFTLQTILQQAGRAQCIAGTSNPKWGRPDLGPPYGDDPNDQHWIMEGWNDYKSGMYGPVGLPRALGLYPAASSIYSNFLQPPINYCSSNTQCW